jgi:hypothetical protein
MKNTRPMKMVVKLAGALTSLSLAFPGIAGALPAPDIEDIPEVDEAGAIAYAADHDSEICHALDDKLSGRKASLSLIYSIITDIEKRSGFNDSTAGYAMGWAMASSCPEHMAAFEALWGDELV